MKKQILFLAGFLLPMGMTAFAQQVPTTTFPSGATANGTNNNQFWSRAGSTNALGQNNIFGTMWNSPIYTTTNSAFRMKLNGTYTLTGPTAQYGINGYSFGNTNTTINTSGYLLVGTDVSSIYTNMGAFSQLHLNGPNSGTVQVFGYRPWMKTGVTLTDNSDLSYMGMRQIGSGADVTETVIAWSDNAGSNSGPDEMAFRYTEGTGTTYNTNFTMADDMDGRHIARFTGGGYMGLGNTFGINIGSSVNYATPMSLLHQSFQYVGGDQFEGNGFHQITYRRPVGASPEIIGQGEQVTDGLRLGIDNQIFSYGNKQFLNSYLRWQENSSLVIQTEDGGGLQNIEQNERMRITSIGALDSNYNILQYDGLNQSINATRISMSELGANPLLRPKSLLHLGFDYGGILTVQGYRKWMDLGVLTSTKQDHVWLGLKPRDSLVTTVAATNDKLDAVMAWGTDREATAPTQVDNMRFIFTGHTFDANPEHSPSTSYNGLEMMRLYPGNKYVHPITNASGAQIDSSITYGRVGIGDFTVQGVNQEPTHKLDVIGNARLRYLPDAVYAKDSTVDKFVMVDTNGVLRWGYAPKGLGCWDLNSNGIFDIATEDIDGDSIPTVGDCQGDTGPIGSFGAHNGTSISTIDSTKVALGNDLGSNIGQLLSHREIPMNNFNTVFTNAPGYNGNTNRLGLGTSAPSARLDITMTPTTPYSVPIALNISMNQAASNGQIIGQTMTIFGNNTTNSGAKWSVQAGQTQTEGHVVMVNGTSTANSTHQGIVGSCDVAGLPILNVGVAGSARGGKRTYGGDFTAQGVAGSQRTAGVHINAQGVSNNTEVIGLHAQMGGSGTGTQYGVFSDVLSTTASYTIGVYSNIYGNTSNPANRAGYFVGPVQVTGAPLIGSDQQFKTNVNPLVGSLKSIQGLRPVSYYMDNVNYSQFGFDSNLQFGFIAQEVANVFPNLVYESLHPAQYDSLGVQTSPAVPYKSLNYNAMIPVNTMAIIELNKKVDAISLSDQSIKTNVQNLTGSLDKVLDMRGVSYDWNHTVHPELNLDSLNQVGFIAQEIQQIDSRLTFLADDSLLHVKYEKVVPILAEAIQELNGQVESKDSIINVLIIENNNQQSTIDDLNNRLTQLENCLSGILPYLCQLSHSAIQANTPAAQEEVRKNLNVTLSNRNTIILDQNVPNPFAEQTIINFSIPETVKKAQIHFYDGNGRFMNSVEVTERGLGSVTVFGSDLSTGVYTYTLIADGQVVATKKMIKQ